MASFDQFDLIRETFTTTGTGTITLAGSAGGSYRTFASKYSNGTQVVVFARNGSSAVAATVWQRWVGTYSGGTITFTTLIDSSTGSQISWPAGTKIIEVSPNPAEAVTAGSGITVTRNTSTGGFVIASSYGDDDVIDVLTDVLDDGYDVEWEVTEDSLGTHFTPNRVIKQPTAAYGAEVTIDLAKDVGSFHTVTLAGNPTLLVTNYTFGGGTGKKKFWIRFIQDATGGRVPDFDGSSQTWTFPDGTPAFTPIPGGEDLLEFLVINEGTPEFRLLRQEHRPRLTTDYTEPASTAAVATTVAGGGVRHFWTFDEASTPNLDTVGDIDLAWTGTPTSVAGQVGNAFSMTTTGDLAYGTGAAIEPMSVTDFTAAGWARITGSPGGGLPFLTFDNTESSLELGWNSSKEFYARFEANGLSTTVAAATTFGAASDSTWYFVAARWNHTTKTLRISVNAGTSDSDTATGTAAETAGLMSVTAGVGATGITIRVDDWGFWNGQLSDGQLTAHHGGTPDMGSTNEEQTLTITGTPTKGSVVLTILPGDPDEVDVTLPYNASAATAETLINAALGAGSVDVTGSALPAGVLTIEYIGDYAATDVPQATVDDTGLNGHAELDWLRELNYVTLNAGTYSPTIDLGEVLPSQTIQVAVENDSAVGTLDLVDVDWGDFGEPALPVDGTFDVYSLTAISATRIIGQVVQTGCTPE